MAKTHQRIFALVAAVLFLATSLATGVAVIWQIRKDNQAAKTDGPNKPTSAQTTPDKQACATDLVDTQVTLPAPEIFKPEADVTTLQTTDLEPGDGAVVKAGDCLTVKYYGTLATDGTKFDEDFTTPKALKLKIGGGSVIKGWDEGIVGMKVGGTRRLVIPSDLAYGAEAKDPIPANSDLVFVVKVLSSEAGE